MSSKAEVLSGKTKDNASSFALRAMADKEALDSDPAIAGLSMLLRCVRVQHFSGVLKS